MPQYAENSSGLIAPDGLADALKVFTWPLHQQAEKTGVVADILKKKASLPAYIVFVRNLLHIYAALEARDTVLERFESLAPFFGPALFRAPSLQRDLENLAGANAMECVALLPATQAYRADIDHAAAHVPEAMLGHIYVRYMGDLFGGQVLQRLLHQGLGLEPQALNFYSFPEISELDAFRAGLRGALNTVELSAAEHKCALDAAHHAFEHNIAVSQAVQAHVSHQI